jgi:hypothetical protein
MPSTNELKPEYEEKQVNIMGDMLCIPVCKPIYVLPSLPAFVGFFVDAATPGERPCRLEEVATNCEGHKVVARFRKD